MANFKIGDVVRLKSGGPDMTVARVGVGPGANELWCVWFDGKKQDAGSFHPDALEASQPRKGVVVG